MNITIREKSMPEEIKAKWTDARLFDILVDGKTATEEMADQPGNPSDSCDWNRDFAILDNWLVVGMIGVPEFATKEQLEANFITEDWSAYKGAMNREGGTTWEVPYFCYDSREDQCDPPYLSALVVRNPTGEVELRRVTDFNPEFETH